VTISDDRAAVDLSAAVEFAAYRIVQESLTNVVRHSDAECVAVSLRHMRDGLVIEIADDGSAPVNVAAAPTGQGGFGLTGMAERAQAVGGRIEYGPVADGGFRVCAVLPASASPP
jgi:signal transduction histidine kinase